MSEYYTISVKQNPCPTYHSAYFLSGNLVEDPHEIFLPLRSTETFLMVLVISLRLSYQGDFFKKWHTP